MICRAFYNFFQFLRIFNYHIKRLVSHSHILKNVRMRRNFCKCAYFYLTLKLIKKQDDVRRRNKKQPPGLFFISPQSQVLNSLPSGDVPQGHKFSSPHSHILNPGAPPVYRGSYGVGKWASRLAHLWHSHILKNVRMRKSFFIIIEFIVPPKADKCYVACYITK